MAIERLTPELYIIRSFIVNVYVLDTGDGLVVLDTGFAGGADKILAGVQAIGRSAKDVRHIILTHCHPDHMGSAAALKQATGAKVWAHPVERPLIEQGITGRRPMCASPGLRNRIVTKLLGGGRGKVPRVEPVTVDQTITGGQALPFAPDLLAIDLPGHSAGQIGLLWQRNGGMLFPADAFLNRRGMRVTVAMEDRELALASIAKLGALDFDAIYFMHGQPITQGAKQQFLQTSFLD